VDARSYLPHAVFDLRYATADNFTHQAVYPAAVCLLRRSTAEKLAAVETQLEKQNLRLKIFDCYRPLSVQRRFWSLVPDERYVADPAKGSRHNRGAAVDLTLVRADDNAELDMGTGFDNFTERAHRSYRNFPPAVLQHRDQLETAMQAHGFIGLPTEWWHFDDTDWQRYPVSDRPLTAVKSEENQKGVSMAAHPFALSVDVDIKTRTESQTAHGRGDGTVPVSGSPGLYRRRLAAHPGRSAPSFDGCQC
jgi:zinc D-Ala-D-Ala dipeptidase